MTAVRAAVSLAVAAAKAWHSAACHTQHVPVSLCPPNAPHAVLPHTLHAFVGSFNGEQMESPPTPSLPPQRSQKPFPAPNPPQHPPSLSTAAGQELRRVQIPSKFTHDAVRRRDRIYVCNTGEGSIVEMSFPGMDVLRTLRLFTREEHVNTLAPGPDGRLWAMLHNLGKVGERLLLAIVFKGR
jgi:hypothetical protein